MVDVRALGYLLACAAFVLSTDELIEGSGEGSGEEPYITFVSTEPPTIQQFSANATAFNSLRGKPPLIYASLEDKECAPKVDLVFLLDTSGSIEQIYHEHVKWTVDLVDALPVDRDRVRIAAIQYAGFPLTEFALGTYLSAADIRQHLSQIKFQSGVTRTGYALRKADSELFRVERGARPDATKIIVLFTDGLSIDDPLKPAHQLRDIKGVKIYVVSVGSDGFEPEMNRIAGDKRNVFGPNELSRLRDTLLNDAGRARNKNSEDQQQQTVRGENAENIEADQAALGIPDVTLNRSTDETDDQILTAVTKYSLKAEDEDDAQLASLTQNEDGEEAPTTTQGQTRGVSDEESLVLEKTTQEKQLSSLSESTDSTTTQEKTPEAYAEESSIRTNTTEEGQSVSGSESTDPQKATGSLEQTTHLSILEGQGEKKQPSGAYENEGEKQLFPQSILGSQQFQRNESLSSEEKSKAIDDEEQQTSDDFISQAGKPGSSEYETTEPQLIAAQKDEVQSGSDGIKELSDKLIVKKTLSKTQQRASLADRKSNGVQQGDGGLSENILRKLRSKSPNRTVTKSSNEIVEGGRRKTERTNVTAGKKVENAPPNSDKPTKQKPARKTAGKSGVAAQNNRRSNEKAVEKEIKAKRRIGGALNAIQVTPSDTPKLQRRAQPILEINSREQSFSKAEEDSKVNAAEAKVATESSLDSSLEGQSTKATIKAAKRRSKRPSRITTLSATFFTSAPTTGSCPLDILFIVDSSGSVQSIYDKQKEYLTSILTELQIGEQRVALLQFAGGSHQKTEWAFDTFADSDAVMHAFTQVRHFTDDATKPAEEIRRLPNLEFYAVSVSELNNFDGMFNFSEYMKQLTDDSSKVYVGERSEELKQLLLKKLHCRG
ncbi:unnamed protein product [Toxocara canis]|uniref:VWFA domain-containing protein n=1 Tax=Toxocara canis TaxID=6265 RepID=A0A183UP02_TOXCA|nr:unnamed protein product [Toxocara canis]